MQPRTCRVSLSWSRARVGPHASRAQLRQLPCSRDVEAWWINAHGKSSGGDKACLALCSWRSRGQARSHSESFFRTQWSTPISCPFPVITRTRLVKGSPYMWGWQQPAPASSDAALTEATSYLKGVPSPCCGQSNEADCCFHVKSYHSTCPAWFQTLVSPSAISTCPQLHQDPL